MNARRKFKEKNLRQQLEEARAHHSEDQRTIAQLNEALQLKSIELENAQTQILTLERTPGQARPESEPFVDGYPI